MIDLDKIECVVDRIVPEHTGLSAYQTRKDYAIVHNLNQYTPPDHYKHKVTGQEFAYFAGGIGWGTKNGAPSFACVVGVGFGDADGDPVYYALDEIEAHDPRALLFRCIEFRKKYGYDLDYKAMSAWYGDHTRLINVRREVDSLIPGADENLHPLTISPPPYFDRARENYAHLLAPLLYPDMKRLHLGPCDRLRRTILNLRLADVVTACDENPALAAICFVMAALEVYKPWMKTKLMTYDPNFNEKESWDDE